MSPPRSPPRASRPGLFDSLGRLLETTVGLLHNRLLLLANDLQLGAVGLLDALVLALLGVAAVGIGLVLLCGWVLLLVEPSDRVWAAGLMTLAFVGGGMLALWAARGRIRGAGAAFDGTREELGRDLAALRARTRPEP
jgi:uncharacterized membrane protein YqjE